MSHLPYYKFIFILLIIIQSSNAFWWSLALPSFQSQSSSQRHYSSSKHNQFCSSLTSLTVEQRLYCQTNPKIFSIINHSLRMAIDECQYQFRNRRWNCSLFDHRKISGRRILRKTAETAFVYALSSAAVMHSVAKACSKGELTECGCGKSQPNIRSKSVFKHRSSVTISSMNRASSRSSNDGFEWGGCSDDLKFGRNVSMLFIDRQERLITRRRIVRMVNMHNNEAGRQAVERNVQLTCKCHGVSGSCTLRVCWRTLPDFRLIGSELRTKYASATQVRFNRRLNILKPRKSSQKLFNKTDLIYIRASPSFCERNLRLGSLGTQGRECHLNTNKPGSCSVICCDRGYETIIYRIEEDCDCQFHWCCKIHCTPCVKIVEKHFCK